VSRDLEISRIDQCKNVEIQKVPVSLGFSRLSIAPEPQTNPEEVYEAPDP